MDRGGTGHLLYAIGRDMRSLEKRGVALSNAKGERNSKEATLLRADGCWQLLYEYSADGHPLIGLAGGAGPPGPWRVQPDPFYPRDISFAASVVETEGAIWLYYSCDDRELKRATIRRCR